MSPGASDQRTGKHRALIWGLCSNVRSHCFSWCRSCKTRERERDRQTDRQRQRDRGKAKREVDNFRFHPSLSPHVCYMLTEHPLGDGRYSKSQSGNRDRTNKASVCPVAWVHTMVRTQRPTRKPGDEPAKFRYEEWHKEIKHGVQSSCCNSQRRLERGHLGWDLRTALGGREFRAESQAEETSSKVLRQTQMRGALRTQDQRGQSLVG